MRDSPEYEQKDRRELEELFDSQQTCLLLTYRGSEVVCGVFNHVRADERLYLIR